MAEATKRIRVPDVIDKKRRGERIVVLTAYDCTFAQIFDRAGADILLVGDSLGNVVLGHETTIPVTMDDMVRHTAAVARGTKRALVTGDLPFLAAQTSLPETVRNAGRLMAEGGAAAVKIEGGRAVAEAISRLVEIGIPVMGHVGLMPQSVHRLGGYRQQAKTDATAAELLDEARIVEAAGAFAIVLEAVPDDVAARVTAELAIPTIGIGAGPHCDGQVLVSYDMLGLNQGHVPSFVKKYAELGEAALAAAKEYADEVRSGRYPVPRKEKR